MFIKEQSLSTTCHASLWRETKKLYERQTDKKQELWLNRTKKKVAWDCSVALFPLPAVCTTSRQLLTGCMMYILWWLWRCLCLLSSHSLLGTFLLCVKQVAGAQSLLLSVGRLCVVFLLSFSFFGVCGRRHLIPLISGLMSQRVLYWWWLWRPGCVCVGFTCVRYRCWHECLLQEWSLLVITGCNLVIFLKGYFRVFTVHVL